MIDQAQGLAQTVPTSMQRHLGALGVRVQVPARASEAEISDAIAEGDYEVRCGNELRSGNNALCTFIEISK
jgi:hypothetical protein